MGNPGGDLPAEGAVHAAALGSKAVVSCGSWGRPVWLQGCRGGFALCSERGVESPGLFR